MKTIKSKYKHGRYIMLHFNDGSRMLEHRYVIELSINRKLLASEVVHHVDNDGTNNSLYNLIVTDHEEHGQIHHKTKDKINIKCPVCNTDFMIRHNKHRYAIKNNKKMFCSRSCSGKCGSDLYWKKRLNNNLSESG